MMYFEEVIKIANRSSMKRYGTGCVIVKGKEIISNGWSHKGQNLGSLYSLHAELHALARGRHLDLQGTTCYIATIAKKSGNLTTARPCIRCAIALRTAGVTQVQYTIPQIGGTTWEVLPTEILVSEFKIYKSPNGSHTKLTI